MNKAEFMQETGQMYEEMTEWRRLNPEASFDEIAEKVGERRRLVNGKFLKELAEQEGVGKCLENTKCPQCEEGEMHYKGVKEKTVAHREGEAKLERGRHDCTHCDYTLYPLDEKLKLGSHQMTPKMVSQAVRTAVEVPSYRRAADLFSELTQVSVSKSTLHRMSVEHGGEADKARTEEAKKMVEVPKKEEEVTNREVPEPDSPMMNVSSDGCKVHIIGEGWKEVKTVAVSAVERTIDDETGEIDVKLSKHSYQAGLWEAKDFANYLWAESCRRGLEKATWITSVNDGAHWIWSIVVMCFMQCVQILDWWHAVQYLWDIAGVAFKDEEDNAKARAWVDTQKRLLSQSQLRLVMRNIRLLFPRGQELPESVRKSVFYLFHNRWRMRYREFRAAGCPIGSGSVESACKLVVQQRMKQSGMRWSRGGAQSMLALRSLLLSDRWDVVEASLAA